MSVLSVSQDDINSTKRFDPTHDLRDVVDDYEVEPGGLETKLPLSVRPTQLTDAATL